MRRQSVQLLGLEKKDKDKDGKNGGDESVGK
jgi:hypothetical protein